MGHARFPWSGGFDAIIHGLFFPDSNQTGERYLLDLKPHRLREISQGIQVAVDDLLTRWAGSDELADRNAHVVKQMRVDGAKYIGALAFMAQRLRSRYVFISEG